MIKGPRFNLLAICSMAAAFGAHAQESGPEAVQSSTVQESPTLAEPVAATAATTVADAAPAEVQIDEVIVTARRKWESLQDVPQSVNVVSNDTLDKLSITNFEDVQTVVPGLTMSSGDNGYSTAATIRGASYSAESGATPTVEFYLNDSPIQSIFLFQSMFDVGQIEALRGPQGTLRGRAAPSGSITATTQRPDLSEVGGYATMTRTNQDLLNINGAINLPIITDKLAVRLAALEERSEGDGVRSINSNIDPKADTQALRASVRYEPIDQLEMHAMYQHLDRDILSFTAAESFFLVDPTATPPDATAYPTLRADQRLSNAESPIDMEQKQDIVTGGLSWTFADQKLAYIGAYQKGRFDNLTSQDSANIAIDYEFYQDLHNRFDQQSHELRLSSEERLFDFIDYTAGAFYLKYNTANDLTNSTLVGIQTGQYTVRPVAVIGTPIERRGSTEERSLYGTLTFHITENTELAAGIRHIEFKTFDGLKVSGAQLQDDTTKEHPTIYNLTLSQRWTPSFMTYAAFGTSWRNGADATGIFRPLTPNLKKFTQLDPEDSRTYELGFKTDFLDRRLRIDAAIFHQDFSNYLYRGPSVYYVNLNRAGETPATFNFVSNVDAKVDGVEVNIDYRPIRALTMAASFSYAKGKIKNGEVACNDFDGDGKPDHKTGTPTVDDIKNASGGEAVAACTINDRLSNAPEWTTVLQSEYRHDIGAGLDGFLRGLYTFYPSNETDPYNDYDNVGAYGLLNLYTGLGSHGGAWELTVFVKNVLGEDRVLSRSNGPQTTGYQQLQPPDYQTTKGATMAGPYMTVHSTAPREVGATLRYNFGM